MTAPLLEWVERKSLSLRLPMKGSMPPSGLISRHVRDTIPSDWER
jgi:hypothetical protein